MLRRLAVAAAAATCAVGLVALPATAASAAPVGDSAGSSQWCLAQGVDFLDDGTVHLAWSSCERHLPVIGIIGARHFAEVTSVWFERAETGPNPSTWETPIDKASSNMTQATRPPGDDWWRTCGTLQPTSGSTFTLCGNWYRPHPSA